MDLIHKMVLLVLLLCAPTQLFCSPVKSVFNSMALKRDSIIQHRTVVIDRKRYTASKVVNDSSASKFYVSDKNRKIVYEYEGGGVVGFTFMDFNGDGYKDIIVELRGVDSGQQDLIVYDPKSKKFKLAGNCSNAKKILKTKYYYTYEDCCLGRSWSSELFYISNSKIISTGYIKYSDGDGIFFFRVEGKRKIRLKKWLVRINGDTPITTGPHIDFDLGRYWTKHWTSFK